jgi:YggT family protein
VTPKVTPPVVLWLFGFVWLFWLRVALHYALLVLNLAPRLGGAAS